MCPAGKRGSNANAGCLGEVQPYIRIEHMLGLFNIGRVFLFETTPKRLSNQTTEKSELQYFCLDSITGKIKDIRPTDGTDVSACWAVPKVSDLTQVLRQVIFMVGLVGQLQVTTKRVQPHWISPAVVNPTNTLARATESVSPSFALRVLREDLNCFKFEISNNFNKIIY